MKTRLSNVPLHVQTHLHADVDVTRARLESFAVADVDTQLAVLATLRVGADDQEGSQLLGVYSIAVAVLALLLTLSSGIFPRGHVIDSGPYWWIGAAVEFVVVLTMSAITVFALVPLLLDQFRTNRSRARAVVWLGAYQDEIARRRGERGRSARTWRRDHPL